MARTRLNRHAVELRVLDGIAARWTDPTRGIYRMKRLASAVSVWLTTEADYPAVEAALVEAGYRVTADPEQPDAGSRMLVELGLA